MTDLKPDDVVVIRAADDWPEHLFRVDEVFEDCVRGFIITCPLAGVYGEPGLELILRVIDPAPPQSTKHERRRRMFAQIKDAYLNGHTWLYRRNCPVVVAFVIGSAALTLHDFW